MFSEVLSRLIGQKEVGGRQGGRERERETERRDASKEKTVHT